jgi:ArsR family transcriptional regulator, arsenate/arsenite/antimonite-responsive transcriptional repressor / arsenate reductase (thioredoxin)
MYCGRVGTRQGESPPGFLRLAGEPLRWRLLGELTRSDRQVRELTALLGQPQNLVSYHLARLRAGGLVTMRRSSADGRDAYYSIDLARCGELLAAAGAALHPGLRLLPPEPVPSPAHARVLFLCTGNSARSQMAQAIMERLAGTAVTAASAGSHPKPVHPNAIAVMREHGIDITGRQAKHMSVFAGQYFDYVISLCDRVREVCPEFPGPAEVIHWSIPDPAAGGGSDAQTQPAFRAVAADLQARIGFLLARINDRTSRAQEVDELCQTAMMTWSASGTWSTTCRRLSTSIPGSSGSPWE